VVAKCDDQCDITNSSGKEYGGYVPDNLNIGGGEYLEFEYCLDCGQIQAEFPLGKTDVEEK
jgi:hypothetical protein